MACFGGRIRQNVDSQIKEIRWVLSLFMYMSCLYIFICVYDPVFTNDFILILCKCRQISLYMYKQISENKELHQFRAPQTNAHHPKLRVRMCVSTAEVQIAHGKAQGCLALADIAPES